MWPSIEEETISAVWSDPGFDSSVALAEHWATEPEQT